MALAGAAAAWPVAARAQQSTPAVGLLATTTADAHWVLWRQSISASVSGRCSPGPTRWPS